MIWPLTKDCKAVNDGRVDIISDDFLMIPFFFFPIFIATHSTKCSEMGLHEELTTMSLESSAFPFVQHPEYPLTRNEWLKHYRPGPALKRHTHTSKSTPTSQFKAQEKKWWSEEAEWKSWHSEVLQTWLVSRRRALQEDGEPRLTNRMAN